MYYPTSYKHGDYKLLIDHGDSRMGNVCKKIIAPKHIMIITVRLEPEIVANTCIRI